MPKGLEGLIRLVYRGWKKRHLEVQEAHPDEEAIASFLEGKLSLKENEAFKSHLMHCESCAEAVGLSLTSGDAPDNGIPLKLINFTKEKFGLKDVPALEIALRIKEKMLEIISASGDILLGQELVPAKVLRSRNISEFKDEIVILKDFNDIRVQVKIENKAGKCPTCKEIFVKTVKSYTWKCMKCGFIQGKDGTCPVDKMKLKKHEVLYMCVTDNVNQGEPGKCPKCGQPLSRKLIPPKAF